MVEPVFCDGMRHKLTMFASPDMLSEAAEAFHPAHAMAFRNPTEFTLLVNLSCYMM